MKRSAPTEWWHWWLGTWGRSRSIFLVYIVLLFAHESLGSDVLDKGRGLLNEGQLKEAAAIYDSVNFKHPLFTQKLEDLVQWHLLKGRYDEGWKLIIVAERVGLVFPDRDYLKSLLALLKGVCAIDRATGRPEFLLLLKAHVYRYANRFNRSTSVLSAYSSAGESKRISHMAWYQLPYLRALAEVDGYHSTQLLPGQGCGYEEDVLDNRQKAEFQEFLVLKSWWLLTKKQLEQSGEPPLKGAADVMVRLLSMALSPVSDDTLMVVSSREQKSPLRDIDLADELLDRFGVILHKEPSWLKASAEEKRFLFQRLIEAGRVPAPPLSARSPILNFVSLMVKDAKSLSEAAAWYSLIKTSSLTAVEHQKILDEVLSKAPQDPPTDDTDLSGEVPARPCLLLNRARLAVVAGKISLALTLIRRLLTGGEGADDSETEVQAEALATDIVTEYRYDEAILGTIHTLLPPRLWGRVFQKLLIDHSIRGESREFLKIMSIAETTKQKRNLRLPALATEILQHMAQRQGKLMSERWNDLAQKIPQQALDLAVKVGERTLGLSKQERGQVQPYLNVMVATFENAVKLGRNLEKYRDIIQLLSSPSAGDRYEAGVQAVRGAIVHAGAVDLKNQTELASCSGLWSPPRSLPIRPLLALPQKVGARTWEIK